jgi:hypothetical protein
MEVAIKRAARFRIPYEFKGQETVQELVIAHAELEFAGGKSDKAFARLLKGYESIMAVQKIIPQQFVDYVLEKARTEKKPLVEKKLLKEKLIYNPFILPADLNRFVDLISPRAINAEIDKLLKEIEVLNGAQAFDKKAALLLKCNRLNDLLAGIKQQKNKFNLLHQVALLKFPLVDETLFDLYVKHLLEAFVSVKHFNTQQELFRKARKFIDLLPMHTREKLVNNILDKLFPSAQIYGFIYNQYNSPLLKYSLN